MKNTTLAPFSLRVSLATFVFSLSGGCALLPPIPGMLPPHQFGTVVNASTLPICKVEFVHESQAGQGSNALNPVDVPLAPGAQKSAEIPRLPEGATGGTWEVRSYTCHASSKDADGLLGTATVSDPTAKVLLK